INYLSGKKAIRFPRNESDLYAYNVSYAVASVEVPFTPKYAFNLPGRIKEFGNDWDKAIIYKIL
ncbi:MAG: hypothetical protein QMD85_02745, partial [Candidatus Aenigmarchaeota archaeon]|nr:hypothetical protein [Candidatus Aenigmarchaeota archaeon]MDI6722468.1 hypothetical protein [Candidatus Aenigmarchaeota archaeon]